MQHTSTRSAAINLTPLVIGIGAPFRGDDELGLAAVTALQKEFPQRSVDFARHSDDPARLINEWSGRSKVIVIDAVRTGATAGTLHRIDVIETGLIPQSRTSSHGNALADAIELSRALGSLPAELVVLGIEPGAIALGDEMSDACVAALPKLIELVKEEIECMSHR